MTGGGHICGQVFGSGLTADMENTAGQVASTGRLLSARGPTLTPSRAIAEWLFLYVLAGVAALILLVVFYNSCPAWLCGTIEIVLIPATAAAWYAVRSL